MCAQPMASARPAMSEVVALLSAFSVEERILTRSIINDRSVRIKIDTSGTPLAYEANATSSTYGSASY